MFPLSFWTPTAEFESRLKTAEAELLKIARRYSTMPVDSWELKTFDTYIPRSAVPCLEPTEKGNSQTLKMHCVQATVTEQIHGPPSSATAKIPLVNLHGYMNAGAYFYRNFGGLCRHFQTVYALDMLGWGQSSRVPFEEVKESETIESAEEFLVESLETWRSENKIEKMILSGHSFGAYVAVAYCERYPEHVDRLIMLSPFGVTDPADPNVQRKIEWMQSTLRGQAFLGIFRFMFDWTTPGSVIRSFTEHRGLAMARSYVERRLPQITDPNESEVLADYLYLNAVLPPSGEFFLRSLFTNSMLAKRPLLIRIPGLKVGSIHFLYGTTDWMDISGGMYTKALINTLEQQQRDGSSSNLHPSISMPEVNTFLVPNAGHLLILQNPKLVNNCMIAVSGGDAEDDEMPDLMDIDESEELSESWLLRAREILKGR